MTDPRRRLAAEQAALLAALVGHGSLPDGFDPGQAAATADVLLRKRASSVARACPVLARSLSGQFDERFAAYASATPMPRTGGALADGRAFARALRRAGALPIGTRKELVRRRFLRLSGLPSRLARR
ncbi:MAG: hypothetical protein ACRD0K_07160 [Egibacteraceae bacterium]